MKKQTQQIKEGQVVKFHTPMPDEDPDQTYIVLKVVGDTDRPRADIKPLDTGLKYPPVNTVPLEDVELVKK